MKNPELAPSFPEFLKDAKYFRQNMLMSNLHEFCIQETKMDCPNIAQ